MTLSVYNSYLKSENTCLWFFGVPCAWLCKVSFTCTSAMLCNVNQLKMALLSHKRLRTRSRHHQGTRRLKSLSISFCLFSAFSKPVTTKANSSSAHSPHPSLAYVPKEKQGGCSHATAHPQNREGSSNPTRTSLPDISIDEIFCWNTAEKAPFCELHPSQHSISEVD